MPLSSLLYISMDRIYGSPVTTAMINYNEGMLLEALKIIQLTLKLVVYRMEFDKTRWSSSWNSDQNCTQNSARGWWGPRGWVGIGLQGVLGDRGVGGGCWICLI